MTTATAPRAKRDVLEDRWHLAVTTPEIYEMPDKSRSTGLDNSKGFYRWEETVVEIATRMKGDGLGEEELEAVETIAAGIWEDVLKARLVEWAEQTGR